MSSPVDNIAMQVKEWQMSCNAPLGVMGLYSIHPSILMQILYLPRIRVFDSWFCVMQDNYEKSWVIKTEIVTIFLIINC